MPNRRREGLGLTEAQYYQSSTKRQQRKMVTLTIRKIEEERRNTKMVQLTKHGACNRLEGQAKQLSPREVLETSNTSLKFLV